MRQWLWVLYVEEFNKQRSIINAGLVVADSEADAREKAQLQIKFNLLPGMAINVTDDIMNVSVASLMRR